MYHFSSHAVLEFTLTQSVVSVNEGDGSAEVCVRLVSGSAPRTVTINLGTSDNTAVGKYIATIYILYILYVHVHSYTVIYIYIYNTYIL